MDFHPLPFFHHCSNSIMVSSCQYDKKVTPDATIQELLQDATAKVTVPLLKIIDFEDELVSNVNINAQIVA